MIRRARIAGAAALAAFLAAGVPAEGAPAPFRIAFVGAASGPGARAAAESLGGLRLATSLRNVSGGLTAQKRTVEVVPYDDGDSAEGVAAALDRAAKEKVDAVVAVATGVTAEALGQKARAGRLPVLVLGTAAPAPVLDPASPVLSLVPSHVDHARALANLLALRSTKPLVGITGETRKVGVVAEDSAAGRALADALERNLGRAQSVAARVLVPPRGRPDGAAIAALRTAQADRLVVLGEPDLLDGLADALAEAKWRIPVLGGAGTLSDAAGSLRDGRLRDATLVAALPQRVLEPPTSLAAGWGREHEGRLPGPRATLGWLAADLLFAAVEAPKPAKGGDLLAALRDVRYGADEASMPVFDGAGRAALFRFLTWRVAEKGPEPVNRTYLPFDTAGPLLGMHGAPRAAPPPGGKVAWVTFGDEKSRDPRSIEKDLVTLGLCDPAGGAKEVDGAVLDELLARTVGKFHQLFLKEYDGSAVPGVSFNVTFTATKPEGVDKAHLWTVLIAGTGNPARKGGSGYPAEGAVTVHSSWLTKNLPALSRGRLYPPLGPGDLPFLRGEYPWSRTLEENQRADGTRGLVDALAGAFAMKGAKELGLLAGLSLEHGDDIRSIMNVNGGEGLRETNVYYTPREAKILERTLGRVAAR